jgi:hypothetical protein
MVADEGPMGYDIPELLVCLVGNISTLYDGVLTNKFNVLDQKRQIQVKATVDM